MATSTAGCDQESTELRLRKKRAGMCADTHTHTRTHASVRPHGIHTSSRPDRVFLPLAHNARLSTPDAQPGRVPAGAGIPTGR